MNSRETRLFMQELLKRCIGSVMIEENQWNFPDDFQAIPRGYFNERLKTTTPINKMTSLRLIQLFSYMLTSKSLTGKFQEPQAVKASNEIIDVFNDWFNVNLSLWHNTHNTDNTLCRHHLLFCLERILEMCVNKQFVPIEEATDFLTQYAAKIKNDDTIAEYPDFIGEAPYGQTEYYLGRDKLTSQITEYILKKVQCYLHGIGGIGKTEIAKDVLKSIRRISINDSKITHILWVDYIENSFSQSLIKALSITESSMDKAFNKAVNVINKYGERLFLIIDNVENPSDDKLFSITSYLNCRILITSRCDGYKSIKRINIPTLDKESCKQLFYYYYRIETDDIYVERVLELADYHTVTIELLAKIADTEEIYLKNFYQTLVECGFHIGSEVVSAAHEKLRSEAHVIEQLVKLFKVYGCSNEEQDVLIQSAVIPNIPFFFEQAKKWFGITKRQEINHLADKGWIKKESTYTTGQNRYRYIMHSVIASAVRAQFIDSLYDRCQSFIQEITIDMKKCVNENDTFKKNLIQFSWSLNDIFNGDFQSEGDCEFLWALSEIYRDIGFYARTIPLLDRLLEIYKNLYGEDCIQQASVWNSKGMIAYTLSHIDDALLYYEKCADIQKKHKMTDSYEKVNHARLEINIGKIYIKHDYTKSIPYFNDAYAVLKEELGENSCDTLNALAHRAIIMKYQGNPQETERIFLEILEKINDTDDRDFLLLKASVSHHLGDLYSDYAPDKAMTYFTTAKDIFSKLLSPTNPDTIDVLNSICSFESSHGMDLDKTLSDMNELLRLYIEIYGQYDPNVAVEYVNIGLCLANMNQNEIAVEYYEEALKIYKAVYNGEDNGEFAYIYTNIGAVYCQMNDFRKAVKYDLKAIAILEKSYHDKRNLDLATAYSDIADAYLGIGDIDKTQKYLDNAFAILDVMVDENSHYYYLPCSTLAALFEAVSDYENAEYMYRHTANIMLANEYPEDEPTVVMFLQKAKEMHSNIKE